MYVLCVTESSSKRVMWRTFEGVDPLNGVFDTWATERFASLAHLGRVRFVERTVQDLEQNEYRQRPQLRGGWPRKFELRERTTWSRSVTLPSSVGNARMSEPILMLSPETPGQPPDLGRDGRRKRTVVDVQAREASEVTDF